MSPQTLYVKLLRNVLLIATLVVLSAVTTAATHATESEPLLVKDIFPGPSSSEPGEGIEINGVYYFFADDGVHGYELWRSDGTAEGTMMVKDVWPGNNPTDPYRNLVQAAGNILVFSASDGEHGDELWRSDGTPEGTVMVKDIYEGSSGSYPFWMVTGNGVIYFVAADATHGNELWRTDGSAEGTFMLKDITPNGGTILDSENIAVSANTLYFLAGITENDYQLWKSDGTTAGTLLVDENVPGTLPFIINIPLLFVTDADTAFVVDYKETGGQVLWFSDGTPAGTHLTRADTPDEQFSYMNYFAVVNNLLFFIGTSGSDSVSLWRSDGTADGTFPVKQFGEGSLQYFPDIYEPLNDKVLFSASAVEQGMALWQSDGTVTGTVEVKQVVDPVDELTVFKEDLFYIQEGFLWRTDGTAGGTSQVVEVDASEAQLVAKDDEFMWFAPINADDSLCAIWQSDGTPAGTFLLKESYPHTEDPDETSCRSIAEAVAGSLFFRDFDEDHGRELWFAKNSQANPQRYSMFVPTVIKSDN